MSPGESIAETIRTLNLGPRGGNLMNPNQNPERRTTEFNGEDNGDGMPGLHRFENTAKMGLKDEKAWHRMAAFMLLAGRTNVEIAMAANVGKAEVTTLRGQLWFQQLLATIANETGEEIVGLIQGEAVASVEKLIALRDFSESDRIQLTAATTLLEHAKGKPVQSTITHSRDLRSKLSPQEEMEEINQELERLRSRKEAVIAA